MAKLINDDFELSINNVNISDRQIEELNFDVSFTSYAPASYYQYPVTSGAAEYNNTPLDRYSVLGIVSAGSSEWMNALSFQVYYELSGDGITTNDFYTYYGGISTSGYLTLNINNDNSYSNHVFVQPNNDNVVEPTAEEVTMTIYSDSTKTVALASSTFNMIDRSAIYFGLVAGGGAGGDGSGGGGGGAGRSHRFTMGQGMNEFNNGYKHEIHVGAGGTVSVGGTGNNGGNTIVKLQVGAGTYWYYSVGGGGGGGVAGGNGNDAPSTYTLGGSSYTISTYYRGGGGGGGSNGGLGGSGRTYGGDGYGGLGGGGGSSPSAFEEDGYDAVSGDAGDGGDGDTTFSRYNYGIAWGNDNYPQYHVTNFDSSGVYGSFSNGGGGGAINDNDILGEGGNNGITGGNGGRTGVPSVNPASPEDGDPNTGTGGGGSGSNPDPPGEGGSGTAYIGYWSSVGEIFSFNPSSNVTTYTLPDNHELNLSSFPAVGSGVTVYLHHIHTPGITTATVIRPDTNT